MAATFDPKLVAPLPIKIRFQTSRGEVYEADLLDDRLMNIRPVSSPPSPPKPEPASPPKPEEDEETESLEDLYEDYGYQPVHKPDEMGLGVKKLPITDNVFRSQLSSIMTDNKYDRLLKNRTRGRLDMTRLPKAKSGSSSVFTQKKARKNKAYNVVLVVDESGSMGDLKARIAAECTEFLAAHLDGLVSLAIVGFNGFIEIHKEFDAPPIKELGNRVYGNAQNLNNGAGANNDYEALDTAYKLLKDKEGNNIVIFMSDGEPASAYTSRAKYPGIEIDDDTVIQNFVKAHPTITTIGIGIMSDARQVPGSIQVNNLDELKPTILKALKAQIKRG